MPRTFTTAGNIVEPSDEDWARAEAFVDREFSDCSPQWLASHRASLIRQSAIAEMQERQNREFRAAVAKSAQSDEACLAAIGELPSLRAGLSENLAEREASQSRRAA